MSRLHRFYVGPDARPEDWVSLEGEEAHHALRVVRVRPGEDVALFDGRGGEWDGVVETVGRNEVAVRIAAARREPRPARSLTVVQGGLDNDKAVEQLVRRLTELGVGQIVFFRAQRSQRPVKTSAKLERVAVEAAKQCGRLWLPELSVASSIEEVLAAQEGLLLLATWDAPPVPLRHHVSASRAALLMGPEGGFTEEETAAALDRGAAPLSLGQTVYRAEVAAGLASALMLYEWGLLGPVPQQATAAPRE